MVYSFTIRVWFGDGDLFSNAYYTHCLATPCEWRWAMVDTDLEFTGLWSLEQWDALYGESVTRRERNGRDEVRPSCHFG